MAKIIIKTDSFNEAKKILTQVYKSDRSATYCNARKTVDGSSIYANILDDNSVEIQSAFYNEVSLKQMFEKS